MTSISDILSVGSSASELSKADSGAGTGLFKEENNGKETESLEQPDAMQSMRDLFKTSVETAPNKTSTVSTVPEKKRGRPKKVVANPEPTTPADPPSQSATNIVYPPTAVTIEPTPKELFDSKSFSDKISSDFDAKKSAATAAKSNYNKRGALKSDVKWAMETLTQARRNLSPEEKKKVRLGEEINKYYQHFPQLLGANEKKSRDINKVSITELQEERRDIKQRLAEPQAFSLTEDIFFGGMEIFEKIYMKRFYGTRNDFLRFNISGLTEHLKGNPEKIRPELEELSIEFADYLSLGPFNRLMLKTMKAASDTHMKNTCGGSQEVINKYKNIV